MATLKTAALLASAMLLASCAGGDDKTNGAGAADPSNWTAHNGGDDESSYSRLGEITSKNIAQLGLTSYLDLPGEMALQATPLAVDGKLYFSGSLSAVYAVDAVSGKLIWRYDPQISEHMPMHQRFALPVNRGLAYDGGKVFIGALDGRLIALDAQTGRPVWTTETIPADVPRAISGAPRVCDGKVLIGSNGADWGQRGYVAAYDVTTGKLAWRFYTTPGDPSKGFEDDAQRRAAATWRGQWWITGTGGTVWNGLTCDAELHQLYIGTGNSGPYDPEVRSPGGGDNLYLASMVALDPRTGRYIWHYQVNPREAWDWKATADMITTTLEIDGKPRKVLMQAPTNGFFYVLDRTSGKLISAEKITKATWADRIDLKTGRPVERPGIRFENGPVTMWPSPFGAHNWQAMSYNPRTGLVYIPTMKLAARYERPAVARGSREHAGASGQIVISPVKIDADDGTAALLAWNPVTQKRAWEVRLPSLWNGGVMSTAGDLVFQGNGAGFFEAFDAETGKKLWSFNAGHGIVGAPITYRANGKQYVSVLVGWGGGVLFSQFTNQGWKFGAQPRRLLTFALDGKAILPRSAPPDFKVHALDDPAFRIDERRVARGAATYAANCALCHGVNLASPGNPGPDLREAQIPLSLDAMKSVLSAGAFSSSGMPRYDNLTEDQISDLQHYIRAGAREALGKRTANAAKASAKGL
jgi:quinohemoprotein ethanol dehydrogenase